MSPNSGADSTVPAKGMRYRESNASRLRQEIKGMTVTGAVRNPRSISSRSNSASECGSPWSRATKSRNTTPDTTPRSNSRQPSVDRSKERRMNHSIKAKKEVDKLPDISGTPCSASVNSCKLPRDTPSEHECLDTRKTVNSVSPARPPTANDVLEKVNNKLQNRNDRPGACKSAEPKGYGKPLVTPVNKRLTIRRDQPWPYNNPNNAVKVTSPNLSRKTASPNRKTASPNRKNRAENRESPYQNASLQRPKLISTKIPTKVTVSGNKLRELITNPNVFPDTKIPILKTNFGIKSLRNSSSSIQYRRSNSRSPPRPNAKKSPDTFRDYSNTSYKINQQNCDSSETKHWTADRNKTLPSSPNKSRSPMQERITGAGNNNFDKAKRISPSSIKESNKEKSPFPLTGQYPPVHNNRSFKPQLEDIKSSHLLFNQSTQDSAKMFTQADKDSYRVSQVEKQFDEFKRRHKLLECKKKFQSPRFLQESRFDKIEGLNWITWK